MTTKLPTPPRKLAVALLLIAVALVIVAIAGPIRRHLEANEKVEAKRKLAEQVAAENASAKARYDSEREQILASIRTRIENRDYKGALALAAPYVRVADNELKRLYFEAAGAESRNQRAEHYRTLVATHCTEANVRTQVAAMLAHAPEAQPEPRSVARLAGPDARAAIRLRMFEPPPKEPEPGAAAQLPSDWLERARIENTPRILPDYQVILLSPDTDASICVWRVEGERRDAGKVASYTLDVWMAPTPDDKGLIAAPGVYRENAARR